MRSTVGVTTGSSMSSRIIKNVKKTTTWSYLGTESTKLMSKLRVEWWSVESGLVEGRRDKERLINRTKL